MLVFYVIGNKHQTAFLGWNKETRRYTTVVHIYSDILKKYDTREEANTTLELNSYCLLGELCIVYKVCFTLLSIG